MWIMATFAGLFSLILACSFYIEYMPKEIPWNANDAAKDVGGFHAFAAAAEIYMRDHASDTSFRPAGVNEIRWAPYTVGGNTVKGLSQARGLPSALAGANINPAWSIRINGDSYVLCTDMTVAGIAKMARLPSSPVWNPSTVWQQGNMNLTITSTTVRAVTFDVDSTTALQCQ